MILSLSPLQCFGPVPRLLSNLEIFVPGTFELRWVRRKLVALPLFAIILFLHQDFLLLHLYPIINQRNLDTDFPRFKSPESSAPVTVPIPFKGHLPYLSSRVRWWIIHSACRISIGIVSWWGMSAFCLNSLNRGTSLKMWQASMRSIPSPILFSTRSWGLLIRIRLLPIGKWNWRQGVR